MKPTEQELMAYVDGELTPPDTKRVAQAVAKDEEAAAFVRRARQARDATHLAYDMDTEPLSPGLKDLAARLNPTTAVGRTPIGKSSSRGTGWNDAHRGVWSRGVWPIAAAACLVIGFAAGGLGVSRTVTDAAVVLAEDGGKPVLGSQLATVLNTAITGQAHLVKGDEVSIEASFVAASGAVCRQFLISAPSPSAGIACREDAAWRLVVFAQIAPASAYQAADGGGDPLAAAAVSLGVVSVLSASEEAEQVEMGWSN